MNELIFAEKTLANGKLYRAKDGSVAVVEYRDKIKVLYNWNNKYDYLGDSLDERFPVHYKNVFIIEG